VSCCDVLLSSMCFWTILRMTISKNLPVVDRRLIRRKFWWNFGSLPGFSNVVNFATFQDFRKWDSLRQWLNKYVKCTNVRLGRSVRHSFGIPSMPQDFSNFNELISFCKSHGLILSRGLVVYGFVKSLNSILHPPSMVFVTQVMACELIFQVVSNCVGFLGRMKFKTWGTMNDSWCPWFIPL
jgi:hypothetical protein